MSHNLIECWRQDHIESSREIIKEQYYSQFNFKPDINPISRQLGQARSIEELHRDTARKQRHEMLLRAKEEALEQVALHGILRTQAFAHGEPSHPKP